LPARAGGGIAKRSIVLLRYLDVVLVAVAAVPVLALGGASLGYAVGAGAWVLQRILAQVDQRWLREAAERRFGLTLVEAFGRIWLLAGAIVAAGVAGGRADGLAAALTIFVAYSVAFAMRLVEGRPTGGPHR
jgi:hypothetical protein